MSQHQVWLIVTNGPPSTEESIDELMENDRVDLVAIADIDPSPSIIAKLIGYSGAEGGWQVWSKLKAELLQ